MERIIVRCAKAPTTSKHGQDRYEVQLDLEVARSAPLAASRIRHRQGSSRISQRPVVVITNLGWGIAAPLAYVRP
ncbi:hypothetical protein Tco_0158245 [Tanacetum coccineum]